MSVMLKYALLGMKDLRIPKGVIQNRKPKKNQEAYTNIVFQTFFSRGQQHLFFTNVYITKRNACSQIFYFSHVYIKKLTSFVLCRIVPR